jgi:hypothetical protein
LHGSLRSDGNIFTVTAIILHPIGSSTVTTIILHHIGCIIIGGGGGRWSRGDYRRRWHIIDNNVVIIDHLLFFLGVADDNNVAPDTSWDEDITRKLFDDLV